MNPIYFTLGDVTESGYTAKASWVLLEAGKLSSYISVPEGTYYVIIDTDSDHSKATYYKTARTVESNKKYLAGIYSTGLTFSEEIK